MDDAEDQARLHAARWAMLLPHREVAIGMLLRATRNLAEAEDCVHDAMLRLVRRADLDPRRVRSLLIRTALQIALDHRHAATREQSALVRLAGGLESEAVSPEQVVAQRAEAARLLAAVNTLPRRERQVMLLRLAGLNVAETAARLGISPKSVEGAYTRARARVRYLLGAVFVWLVERLRRSASARGEAVATTVAALLLLGPGLGGGGSIPRAEDPPRVDPTPALPDRAEAAAAPTAARSVGARPGPPPTGAHPDQRPARPGGRGRARDPYADATVGVPITAPDGLASWGVYVTLQPPDPSTYPQALYAYPQTLEDCVALTVAHPDQSC